ncbi:MULTISPECIES: TetR/AcrR family transcriptional regulator [Micrococcaceae]|uniref:TetR/AcrR family transcriptional regulator n=1 Tax=Glutamicibacter ectropisis TaxID=3046593 RepID=A0AAU6WE20_9MICC|nr:TetR/AcrR family transcriptional regulator [Arthrobacter sp. NIO-1057]KSU65273.1 TetR family transcriptional regulator [Arthrobacter sp. NIO-1057]SCC43767.1 transcriptional regulator, TetR family [Arthrobacter sp. NIO-1057]
MAESGTRRAGRPRKAVLTRERITANALELVSDDGYESFTMQRLAKSLGVSPSALYNHVDSKHDLMQWIQELVMTDIDVTIFDTTPLKDALMQWATDYRNIFARHIPLIPIIAVLPVSDSPRTLGMYERVAQALEDYGLAENEIIPTIVALESFIFGSAMDTAAPHDIFDTTNHQDLTPHFTQAVAAQRNTQINTSDDSFQRGLSAMITGLLATGRAS